MLVCVIVLNRYTWLDKWNHPNTCFIYSHVEKLPSNKVTLVEDTGNGGRNFHEYLSILVTFLDGTLYFYISTNLCVFLILRARDICVQRRSK